VNSPSTSTFTTDCHSSPLRILNLQHRLAKVLALEDAHQSLRRIVNTLHDMQFDLDTAFRDPLRQLLLVLLRILIPEARVTDNEAAEGDALADDEEDVLDAITLLRRKVVLRNLISLLA
jgi:hypothetical protein